MRGGLPGSLKIVRGLLFTYTAITALTVLGGLLAFGVSPEVLGALAYLAIPGTIALVCALRTPRGGRGLLWGIVVLQVVLILLGIGRLGNGEPQGLTNLVLPALVLFFVLLRPSRDRLSG
ncbi:hypothetical protein [Actinorugispora endophytica]|uniref:Uncharacterized protein n=1 Tax=Actinorugispora endophytica TaxID=1605990 RepID=A0A4R6V8D1_9ACTN|nr:hypothetical protein [Actinorugispora endophytica]TDQ55399.1 hypothetical protein EV190_101726 [Actinorugispora endophytica]